MQYGTSSPSLGTAEHLVFPTDDIFSSRTCEAQCRLVSAIRDLSESQPRNWAAGQCGQLVDDGSVNDIIEICAGSGVGVTGRDDAGIGPFVVVDDGPASRESSDMVKPGDVWV